MSETATQMPSGMTQELADKMSEEERDIWNMKVLSSWMLINQVNAIQVTFSGSGDFGQVDDVSIDTKWDHPLKKEKIPHISTDMFWDRETNERISIGTYRMMVIEDIAESVAMAEATASNVDWYNNEGGSGRLEITPNNLEFSIGYYSRTYHQQENFSCSISERYEKSDTLDRQNLGLSDPEDVY